MSIPNKYDLTLFGNVIVDEICCIPSWAQEGTSNSLLSHKVSIGGIGNILESLSDSNLSIFVKSICGNDKSAILVQDYFEKNSIPNNLQISNKATSQAIIICSLASNERTSFVNWGCGNDLIAKIDFKSKWSHISYLDICHQIDLKHIKENSDIVSADVCLSNPSINIINKTLDNLQYLDYLFVSSSEIIALLNGLSISDFIIRYKLKCLILHTRIKTHIIKPLFHQEICNIEPIVNNINVLGAGDAYCGNFISYQLMNNPDEIKAAMWAHKQATAFILRHNEKI